MRQHRTKILQTPEGFTGTCSCDFIGSTWDTRNSADVETNRHTLAAMRAAKPIVPNADQADLGAPKKTGKH